MSGYDAVIVGAGPAGGMVARVLSSNGFKVLMVDRRKEIGVPVQCAGGLSHFALENVGLKPNTGWIKCEIKGAKTICPNGKWFYVAIAKGYSLDRAAFDKWIVDGAVDNGAELRVGTRANEVRKSNGRWTLVTDKGEFTSKILIGTDGASSNVARWVSLLKNRDFVKGKEYKFRTKDFDFMDREYFCTYTDEKYNGGYGWTIPKGGKFVVGIGGHGHTVKFLDSFVKSLGIDPAKKTETISGIIPYHYELDSFSGGGVLIAGDAAGMTNPMNGGGIHAALFSGKLAGEVASKALEKDDNSVLKEYDNALINSPFLNPVLLKAANFVQRWDNEFFNHLGNFFDGTNPTDMTKIKALIKMLRHPKFLKYGLQFPTMQKALRISEKYGW